MRQTSKRLIRRISSPTSVCKSTFMFGVCSVVELPLVAKVDAWDRTPANRSAPS